MQRMQTPRLQHLPKLPHVARLCAAGVRSSRPCRSAHLPRAVAEPPVKPAEDEGTKAEANKCNVPEFSKEEIEQAIMMQAFGWDSCEKGGWYNIVKDKLEPIKNLGVNFLWMPPPSQSVSPQGYMPGQLYDLNTPYGSEQELRELLAACNGQHIGVLADIVINHRCADQQDDSGRWNIFTDKVDHPGRSVEWGQWAIVGGDGYGGQGNQDSGADFGPAPDLDHTNDDVRESLKDWLRYLNRDVGYYGWRLDYVKGYAAKYVKEYIEGTVGRDTFNVGEFWTDLNWEGSSLGWHQDGARQALCDFIDETGKTCPMFDFPLKGILQEAVRNCEYNRLNTGGKGPGLAGWWPSKAVTFLDNHDTGSTQQHWPFPADGIMTGYAYILTHPGLPCLLWEHCFDWGLYDEIAHLIDIRRRNGITARSTLHILRSNHDLYVADVTGAKGTLRVKLGPNGDMGDLVPSQDDGWKRPSAARGPNFAIWERPAEASGDDC